MFRHHGTAAGLGALGLATALIAAPSVAIAADSDGGSFAEGRFLAGTILSSDLDRVIALEPATAVNDGSAPVAEERNPLSATAIDAITIDPGPIAVTDADGVDAGTIGQYAIARPDGTSYAASGLLASDGAIGVSPASGTAAVVDLTGLLGTSLPSAITGLRLEAAGIAAEAEASLDGVRGGYTLADARLVLVVPALAGAHREAQTATAEVERSLLDLGGGSGPLAGVLDRVLASVGLGGLAEAEVRVEADLSGVLAALGRTVLRDDALTIDLASGTLSVDLAALPDGPGLNAHEPGTELIRDGVVDDIVTGAQRLLRGYLGEVELGLIDAIADARIIVSAHASVLDDIQTGEIVRTITTPVTQVLDALTGDVLGILDPATGEVTSLVPSLSGTVLADLLVGVGSTDLLGGLLGDLPQLTTRVVAEVSTVTQPAFSTLETSADVLVTATLDGLRGGEVAEASASASLLGAPVALDASVIVDGLADALGAALPESGSTPPLGENATGDVAEIAGIGDLVSLRTNVQSTGSDGSFTQTALRVAVLDGELATIDLANATVGPNAAGGGTGGGDDPDPAFAASGELAFTGFALGLIALLGTAFIGLGAYALWRSRAAAAATDAVPMG